MQHIAIRASFPPLRAVFCFITKMKSMWIPQLHPFASTKLEQLPARAAARTPAKRR
jgi:hypothetical protein